MYQDLPLPSLADLEVRMPALGASTECASTGEYCRLTMLLSWVTTLTTLYAALPTLVDLCTGDCGDRPLAPRTIGGEWLRILARVVTITPLGLESREVPVCCVTTMP